MAKKKYSADIDFTWSGETRTDIFLGKPVVISSANEIWDETSALWTDDVIYIVRYVLYSGSRGRVKKQWDTWNAWDKISETNKKKIVNVIVYLKSGVKVESKIDINKYKLTVEDVNLLRDEYEKYHISVKNVKVI